MNKIKMIFKPLSFLEIFIMILIVLGILLAWSGSFYTFLNYFYNPYSFLIIVIMVIEYIILKGRDRSRIYKIQIKHLKERLDNIKDNIRMAEDKINVLNDYLSKNTEESSTIDIEKINNSIQSIKQNLKGSDF